MMEGGFPGSLLLGTGKQLALGALHNFCLGASKKLKIKVPEVSE
jgi:hypothetical protein